MFNNIDKDLIDKYEGILLWQQDHMGSRPAINKLTGKKDIVGVEIGIFFGINAYHILKTFDIKLLYLVDPFTDETTETAMPEKKLKGKNAENIARSLLEKYNEKIQIITKFSWDAVNEIPNNLDFVYIDGDHGEKTVTKDLKLYYPKVKKGGIFGGHDYVADRYPDLMVKSSVDKFFKDKLEEVKTGGARDWWIIKE